jgi:hypothetical protein
VVALFAFEWARAPRVAADPHVKRELAELPSHELYLGTSFEGLALIRVRPFLYSNCKSGHARASLRCDWVRVTQGRVTGSDPQQVRRARAELRPVR